MTNVEEGCAQPGCGHTEAQHLGGPCSALVTQPPPFDAAGPVPCGCGQYHRPVTTEVVEIR